MDLMIYLGPTWVWKRRSIANDAEYASIISNVAHIVQMKVLLSIVALLAHLPSKFPSFHSTITDLKEMDFL